MRRTALIAVLLAGTLAGTAMAAGPDGGIGLTLLLATGALGVVGGLLALVKPERQLVAAGA